LVKRRLIKLVRDRVDQFRTDDDRIVFEKLPSHQDHTAELRKKLMEEATEYLVDPCKEELADVLQVVMDIADHDLCCGYYEIEAIRVRKEQERGGFEEGIGMYVQTDNRESEHG